MKTSKFKIGPYKLDLTKKEFGILINLIKYKPGSGYTCRLCNKNFKTYGGAYRHFDKKHSEFIVNDILKKGEKK